MRVAVFSEKIDLGVQMQSEDVGGGERVALLAPLIFPLPTPQDRAPWLRHANVAGVGRR